MRLSRILSIIVHGKDGRPEWKEVSQKFLPPGGRDFPFPYKLFAGLNIGTFLASYIIIQNETNPDSIYARLIRKIVDRILDKKHDPKVYIEDS